MKRKVAILCPAYDGKVVCDFSVCMAEIFRVAAAHHPDLTLHLNFWMYEAIIQKARNNLFCEAYEAGCDDVVFIDSDQSFPIQAFFDILQHPVDAIGLPVRMKTDDERYNLRPEDPAKHKWNPELRLVETEVIGTGFLRLSRRAMEVLWNGSRTYFDGKERRLICNIDIINGGMISEDVQICEKLRAAGIPIHVDIRYTCDHFGTKRFTGNYKQRFAGSLTDQILKEPK